MRRDGGQALVELGLALPILLLTVLGGADLARVYAMHAGVETAARTAAETAALDASPTEAEAAAAARAELEGVPGLDPAAAGVTLVVHGGDGASACAGAPTLASPCFATVRVTYEFRTLVAWPGVPRTVPLESSRTFRRAS